MSIQEKENMREGEVWGLSCLTFIGYIDLHVFLITSFENLSNIHEDHISYLNWLE